MGAPKPGNEAARLRELYSYRILDTPPEPALDRIASIVAKVLDVPIALVSFIDEDREWFKSCLGLALGETGREVSLGAHAILEDEVLVIPDALQDPRLAANALVTGEPFIRSYAAAPLVTPQGLRLGTLCAIDTRPRELTREQIAVLADLAALVVDELELDRRNRQAQVLEEAQKLVEAQLADSQQALAGRVDVLEAILETAGEGILVADINAQVIIANPLAREITGRNPGESISVEKNPELVRGFFEPDGETPFALDKLPLHNALRGVASDNVELFAKTPGFPEGIYLMTTGRPVRDRDGEVRGGVVTLSDVTALRRAQHRLAELAITDELTRLPNRRALRDRLELLSAEAARGRRFSLAIVDIDHFKKVNDTHGHAVGDEVLIAVAKTLKDSIRRTDMVARMGGEEFCVLQTDIDVDLMTMLTERLRAAIAAITEPVAVTASFGVCHSSKTIQPTALLQHADDALYAAKHAGRNRIAVA